MKVFIASTSLRPQYGGPAFSVASLAHALAKAGAETGLWAADSSTDFAALPPETAVRLLTGSESDALAAFGKPNVLHDNGIWLPHNHVFAAVAAERGIPRLVSTRGMLEPWAIRHKKWKKSLIWWLYQERDLQRAARHHATSDQEAANLQRLGLGVPIASIPNGVDLPDEGQLAAQHARLATGREKVALFLGRIYPIKGLPMLVDAWARVRPSGWTLNIAGPDEAGHRAVVEHAIIANRLGGCVRFLGPVEAQDRMKLYATADLFVLPSYSESFGMAVGEALAHNVPVLTTTAAPWTQLVASGCGWRVEPTTDGLVDGLREATSCDSGTLREMGARAREYVAAEFSWSAVAKGMIALYRDVISKPDATAASE